VIAASLFLVALVARGFARPVSRMADAVTALLAGRATEVPGAERTDELGVLARSLAGIHDAAVANTRIARALTDSSEMVMILDADLEVVFANAAMEEGFRPLWPHLANAPAGARSLVGLEAGQILSDVSVFLQPDRRGAALIEIGDRNFGLSITEMRDDGGQLIGRAVTWRDRGDVINSETEVSEVLDAAVEGDFSRRLDAQTRDRFALHVAKSVNRLNEAAGAFFADLEGMVEALAAGRLDRRMDEAHAGRFGRAAANLNGAAARLADTVADIARAAGGMGEAADAIAGEAGDLSSRTEAQASSLEQTAATMEQMAASVKGTADNAASAEALARDAAARSESGRKVMSDAVTAMSRIEESSEQISDIISVIDSIAFQTNLLALNAAVEAARAGEAGKGFAVVAAEVRTLAQRSSQAAKDIAELIQTSSGHVGEGVRLVQSTGSALEEVAEGIERTARTIADISGSVAEQSSGVQETSHALSHMDEGTQRNASMAEQSAASARRLQNEARWLIERVGFFQTGAAVTARAGATAAEAGGQAARPAPPPASKSAAPPASASRRSPKAAESAAAGAPMASRPAGAGRASTSAPDKRRAVGGAKPGSDAAARRESPRRDGSPAGGGGGKARPVNRRSAGAGGSGGPAAAAAAPTRGDAGPDDQDWSEF
jgi:methyl-accepting chemotaxis protein